MLTRKRKANPKIIILNNINIEPSETIILLWTLETTVVGMGLTIKKPVKEIKANRPVCEVVEEKLKSDPQNGYAIMGLMVECFNVKANEINGKPFSRWRRGLPSLYTRVRLCLERRVKEGKVNKAKQERAGLYWWKS